MTDQKFIEFSHQQRCPHCRGSNTSIHSHPKNDRCKVIFCHDCYGYPSICIENEQTYITDDLENDYCKICGDRELALNTHALAYPYI